MLKLTYSNDWLEKRCTPNILPCRIHHDGPVDASPRYWSPETAQDGKPQAYLRGRKLRGQEIEVPRGYRGVIVKEAGKEKPTVQIFDKILMKGENGEEGEEEQEKVTKLNEVGSFEKVLIWNHVNTVDGDDAFAKGLNEWIGFAEAMHAPGDRIP